MTINPNFPKTAELEKPNGIFIIFHDYETSDDFQDFIKFIVSKLNVPAPESNQYPYSQAAVIQLPDGEITAIFHDNTECCSPIAPGEKALADRIVKACYGARSET